MLKKLLALAGLATAACAACAQGAPNAYPTRPIRIVVPYPAGGATDYIARTIGERLGKTLGQPVVVDNKTGAAGAIGTAEVARSRPDGHTLLYSYTTNATNGPLVISGASMNSGYFPFSTNPIYVDYRPSGFGATVISR